MSIRSSVMGEVAVRIGPNVTGIDMQGLLCRLLLFDTVVIKSIRLAEVPFLVRRFGKDGFLRLLDSGALRIACEFLALVWPRTRNGVRVHPPFTFEFGKADISDREAVLRSQLRRLQGVPGLKNADRELVENETLSRLLRPPAEYGDQLLSQFEFDIRNGMPILDLSVGARIRKEFGANIPAFQLNVEETSPRIFHLANNLSEVLRISDEKSDAILNDALLAVGRLDQRIADMAAYSSITGFSEAEAPLLFGKLAGIIRPMNPAAAESQFARVVTIAEFPELGLERRINVDNLLAARESAELREFRAWISELDKLTDSQVRDIIGGIRNKLGGLVQSGPGKALRFALTTAIGLAGIGPGVAAGLLDTFLVERLLPNSGVASFLTKTYPSLFEADGTDVRS